MGAAGQPAGAIPASIKYTATAATGAAVGSIFPLFLFDKLGIAQLLAVHDSASATVYGITVFAMVAFLILGIGSFLARDDQLAFKRNSLFYIVLLTFVAAFIIGFAFFVEAARKSPELTVKINFDRYADDVQGFHAFALKPYFVHPDKFTFSGNGDVQTVVSGQTKIIFGIDNLHDLEAGYAKLLDQLQGRIFDNKSMGEICNLPQFVDVETCRSWNHEGAEL